MKRSTKIWVIAVVLVLTSLAIAAPGWVESGGYVFIPKMKVTGAGGLAADGKAFEVLNAGSSVASIDKEGDLTVASCTGCGGGVEAVGAVGSSPNANAATITGTTLNLEPASASFPGVVTTGAQTFNGDKKFTGAVLPAASLTYGLGNGTFVWNGLTARTIYGADDNARMQMNDGQPLGLLGDAPNGGTAIGVKIQNLATLSTSGAKIISFYPDLGTTEVAAIDKDGNYLYVNTVAPFLISSAASNANVTSSVPAIRMRGTVAYSSNDLVFQVTDSSASNLFKIDQEGDGAVEGWLAQDTQMTLFSAYPNALLADEDVLGGHATHSSHQFVLESASMFVSVASSTEAASTVLRMTSGSDICEFTFACNTSTNTVGPKRVNGVSNGGSGCLGGSNATWTLKVESMGCGTAPTVKNIDIVGRWAT